MVNSLVPKKKIGVLAPRAIVDVGPFEFYQMAPKGIMLTIVPLGIKRFTREGVEEAYRETDEQLQHLVERRCRAIVQEGVPLQCLVGTAAHDRRLAYIRKKTGLPTSSGVLGGVEAARHLGVTRIAFANKFTDRENESLAEFFTREGIEVTGYVSWGEEQPDKEVYGNAVKRIRETDLVKIGFEVGRRAFRENPRCEGIYMPGGSWALNKVVIELEKEFGKPVFGHRHTSVWHMVRMLDMWKPKKGWGRLFATA